MHKFTKILLLCLIMYQANIVAQTGIYAVQGDLTLSTGASTEIQLKNTTGAGTGNDQIATTGNLTLAGPLNIVLDGYTPNLANTFAIASYSGTLSGTFSSIVWPVGMTTGWSIDYGVLVPGKVTIFGSQSPLPVVLVDFHGRATAGGNELSWQTASEVNADYFNIEHSLDGRSWSEAGRVRAKGNSSAILNYNYLHTEAKSAMCYYRLKLVDYDGSYDYSSTISINRDAEFSAVRFYPNPTSGIIQFSNTVDHVRVFDVTGKTLLENTKVGNSLDISHLSSGTYYISINQAAKAEIIAINK